MNENNNEMITMLKTLANSMNALLAVATKPHEAETAPAISKPVEAQAEAVTAPAADEGSMPTEQDKRELAFSCGYVDTYCKAANNKWPDYHHMEAQADYNRVRTAMVVEGIWKTRPTNPRRNKVTTTNTAVTAAVTATPVAKPVLDPEPLSAMHDFAQGQEKLPDIEANNVDEYVAKLMAEVVTLINGKDQIGAIKRVRERTNMSLLPAKLLVDTVINPSMEIPAILTAEIEAFKARWIGTHSRGFDAQVKNERSSIVNKSMDADKGKADGQRMRDISADANSGLVQVAQRIARDLAVNGPITIDDVTLKMSETHNVASSKGKKEHQWKGSVFGRSEWACVGEMPSRQKLAHARPVKLWALKSWLKDNTLNGKETSVSSFILSRLYRDFTHLNRSIDLKACNCHIGEEKLSNDIRQTIINSGNKLYEVPVSFVPGAVGALILLPGVEV